jgi:DNA-binding response OmpR family regulator
MEERAGNAIADATLVATLKGRIDRAEPGRRDAARLAVLDLALQACYGKHLLDLQESASPDKGTTLHLCVGAPKVKVAAPRPAHLEMALDHEHCAAIVDGRVVKLTAGTMSILSVLAAARGEPVPGERLAAVCPGEPSRAGLSQRIWRLRELLDPLGVQIVTVRGRGWALTFDRIAAPSQL